jgi:hypothetical protein
VCAAHAQFVLAIISNATQHLAIIMRKDLVRIKYWPARPPYAQWVAVYRAGYKRQLHYFASESAAKAFAAVKRVELLNEGRRHAEITDAERRAIHAAREAGFSLKDAVDHYATHLEAFSRSAKVEVVIDELLSIREAEGKALSHIADLRHRLLRFAREHGTRVAASISTREIDAWLSGLACAPQTRINYRRALHGLFAFCAARGYCTSNPVTHAAKPKVPPSEIGILTVAQAQALLSACPPLILPAVAIAAFRWLAS